MRILLLMDNPAIQTGYAATCRLTSKELVARGHEVWAMAFNGGNIGDSVQDWYGVKVIPNYALAKDGNAIYGDYDCLKRAYEECRPDIMLFHNDSYRYAYMRQMTKEMQEKSVFWLPFEGEQVDKLGLELFSKCAATRFVTNHAMNVHAPGLPGKDLGVIYHAIESGERCPLTKEEAKRVHLQPRMNHFKIGGDATRTFCVSRVDRHQPRKYWKLAIEAFAKFAKGKDDVLFIAKCNPRDCTMWDDAKKQGTDLEAVARELGAEGKVCFDDFFFNAPSLAQAFYWPADVFLTTTSGEGFGLAVAEALSHGVPVIAPNVPVLPEVIGEGGMLCRVKERAWYDKMSVFHNIVDVDDVAAKLEEAYQDWKSGGKRLAEMGAKGRALAERYSPKAVYDQWDQVFSAVKEKRELVTMITVLYNVTGKDQLYGEDGIDRLRETTEQHVKYPYEWIIVDNGSPAREETRAWIAAAAAKNKRIVPLLLDDNLGFAGANNRAIAMAKGRNVVLVNPDSEAIPPAKHGLTKDWLQIYSERVKSDPSIGVLGMKVNSRPDILDGLAFPYFCCAMITRECLDATRLADGKWLDERCWPAYYEDAIFCLRAQGKGFKLAEQDVPFWHKSGGTNKHAIEDGAKGKAAAMLAADLEKVAKAHPDMADWPRKRAELAADGMQGLIRGNIQYLQSQWGEPARKKVRVVWNTHIGAAVGFSELAEGLIPELHRMGFDVYVNDWSNGAKIKNPVIRELYEKTKRAKEQGDDLYDAVNIVCWLMETFLGVDSAYKVGISLCESTKVRESYLQACNSMDRILTFSDFCKRVQIDSGFKSPIHVIPPGVDQTYVRLAPRPPKDPAKDKFTFLNVGVCQERKDTYRLVEAFCEAFPKDAEKVPEAPDLPMKPGQVELVLKSNNFGDLGWITERGYDKRANVRAIFTGWDARAKGKDDLSKEEMYDLYAQADACVFPSHGEGIGMSQLESAAVGSPLIFTNWSSPAEYFDESNSYPISLSPYPGTTFTKAYNGAPGDNGLWANAHIGHLKFLMYHVLRNRDEATAKGIKAHEKVKSCFTWEKSAQALAPLLFEWDAERKTKCARSEFDPLTFVKPKMEPIVKGDRVMLDVATRDRRPYLAVLLCSLLHQTFKKWDLIIEVDDADENILHDHLIMSILARARHEGHDWRMIRSHRQGPHMAHDRTLFMTHENPGRKYKLICRIDDDIYVEPTYLEKLFGTFLDDANCEVGAVGGTYPDPKRSDKEQTPPPGFESDINYAGKIDHNVPWPYVCRYPAGTKPRLVEHLYSSFMYRVEVGVAIGGYCKLFSQIGHREESDFSYRFHLAGYKLYIHPEAVGFHFQAPASGIRSNDIGPNKNELAQGDHRIYERRLAKWKKRAAMRRMTPPRSIVVPVEPGKVTGPSMTPPPGSIVVPPVDPGKKAEQAPAPVPSKDGKRMLAVINGGPNVITLQEAVTRASEFSDEVYVTSPNPLCRSKLSGEKLRMVCCSKEETTILSMALAKSTDYVMTIDESYRFLGDPRAVLVEWMDDYVFEVYKTYEKDGRKFIGPELRNECLISRRTQTALGTPLPDMSKICYSEVMVINDVRMNGNSLKSSGGLDLVPLDKLGSTTWTKVCTFQYPEGELQQPRAALVEAEIRDMVSIIIPTAGRVALLRKCIDSIYSHTSTPFEIIVVDNGSTDGTKEYLEDESAKRPALRFTRNSTNLGFQKAVNIGVAMSRGKYIMLFNDDAWIESKGPDGRDWLSTYMDELDADPKVGLAGPHAPDNGGFSPNLPGTPMLFFWCVMTRRTTWEDVGPLDDVTFFNYGGDDDWCHRLRQKGYSIKQKFFNLRHLMTCVPENVKSKELAESKARLLLKYPKP